MKCAAIREDFLSAITEPAKCMEIEQSEEHIHHILSVSSRKRKETPIPKCFAVAFGGWIFICRYCALNGGGVVLDKFLHTVCDYVWYFSTLANNSHGLVSQV